jgi:hypothetical protein
MKTYKIFLLMVAVAAIFVSSCDDLLADLLKFVVDGEPYEFAIYPQDTPGRLEFSAENYYLNIDSIFNANGLSDESLRSIEASDAVVTIVTEGYNFDPLGSLEIHIEAGNLDPIRLAWLDTIPDGTTSIELDLSEEDVQDYFFEDYFSVKASATLLSTVEDTVDLVAIVKFLFRGGL